MNESTHIGDGDRNFVPTCPLKNHPLDAPGVVKIALGQSASDALRAIGEHHLCIVNQADATAPPTAQGRMVLHCLPLSREQADDAYRVATGKARAAKIPQPPDFFFSSP